MADDGIDAVDDLGFDDLPEFANEANKALHRKLKEHEKALVVVETELVETKERIGTMEEHLTSVNNEQLHTQRLVDAKIKEIETEDHLKQLAERERGRFHAEYKKLQTELAELHDKVRPPPSSRATRPMPRPPGPSLALLRARPPPGAALPSSPIMSYASVVLPRVCRSMAFRAPSSRATSAWTSSSCR